MLISTRSTGDEWPELPLSRWSETATTLHLWTQIIGKVRLVCTPWTNHSWHVPLYVTARGLTTSPIPHPEKTFEAEFDFVSHEIVIRAVDGSSGSISLESMTVSGFYSSVMQLLRDTGIDVQINTMPCEIPDATPFEDDMVNKTYDPEYAGRFWRSLVHADRIFKEFRSGFVGKCSPVHFFWGGFDLAVSRFSGREAPRHPAGVPGMPDWVAREAYSHEVSSVGFWPGGNGYDAMFYAYAYPEPEGFADAVSFAPSFYSKEMGEYLLPYEAVRTADSPAEMLLDFLQATYDAAADLGGWDRRALESDFDQFK